MPASIPRTAAFAGRVLAAAIAGAAGASHAAPARSTHTIVSLNREVVATLDLSERSGPTLRVDHRGQPVVLPSQLGLGAELGIVGTETKQESSAWEQRHGERSTIAIRYEELTVRLRDGAGAEMWLTLRAYDEGVALRCRFPGGRERGDALFLERSEFRFPDQTRAWRENDRGDYTRMPIAGSRGQMRNPLTLELPDGRYAALAEIDEEPLQPFQDLRALRQRAARASGPVVEPSDSTPWRVIVLGRDAGELVERSYLLLNLQPPAPAADTPWIATGMLLRAGSVSTATAKAAIDFASSVGLEHVEVALRAGDSAKLDLREIVRHGREREIGIFVAPGPSTWQQPRERAELFAALSRQGVRGVTLNGDDTVVERSLFHELAERAAQQRLTLHIHQTRPTLGTSRRYPHVFVTTAEGENALPSPERLCTLPFAEIATQRASATGTRRSHRLAMTVIGFNPLQSLRWEDERAAPPGRAEVEFLQRVPTTWDETKVLRAKVGERVALARRKGEDWFVGALGGSQARESTLPLAFLDPGRAYIAHVFGEFGDGEASGTVHRQARRVVSTDLLPLSIPRGGATAVWITPDAKKR